MNMIQSFSIKLDNKLCKQCGNCLEVCCQDTSEKNSSCVNPNSIKCIQCGHCFAVCGAKAISYIDAQGNEIHSPVCSAIPSYDTLLSLFQQRRSCRKFLSKKVEQEVLDKILFSTTYTPSGGNRHSTKVLILNNSDKRSSLLTKVRIIYKKRAKILNNNLIKSLLYPIANATIRAYMKDKHYARRINEIFESLLAGQDPVFYNAPVCLIFYSEVKIPTPREDSILKASYAALSAHTLGIGTCFVTLAQSALNSSAECKNILGLKKSDDIHTVLVLGYPETHFYRNPLRENISVKTI